MEFLPLSRRRSSSRNVPGGEERGETDVFAGYLPPWSTTKRLLMRKYYETKNSRRWKAKWKKYMQLNLYARPPRALVSDHLPCNKGPPILNTKTFPVKALQLELLENHHLLKATATTLWAWKFKDFLLCLTSCKRPLDAFSVGKRSLQFEWKFIPTRGLSNSAQQNSNSPLRA